MKPIVLLLSVAAIALVAAGLTDVAYAQDGESGGTQGAGVTDGS